jgi:hypothetical protein
VRFKTKTTTTTTKVDQVFFLIRNMSHRSLEKMQFLDLPDEIVLTILGFTSARTVCLFSEVSKVCFELGQTDVLWKTLLHRDFPLCPVVEPCSYRALYAEATNDRFFFFDYWYVLASQGSLIIACGSENSVSLYVRAKADAVVIDCGGVKSCLTMRGSRPPLVEPHSSPTDREDQTRDFLRVLHNKSSHVGRFKVDGIAVTPARCTDMDPALQSRLTSLVERAEPLRDNLPLRCGGWTLDTFVCPTYSTCARLTSAAGEFVIDVVAGSIGWVEFHGSPYCSGTVLFTQGPVDTAVRDATAGRG